MLHLSLVTRSSKYRAFIKRKQRAPFDKLFERISNVTTQPDIVVL